MPATLVQPSASFELKPYKSLSNDELQARISAIRADWGPKLLILGHHYQQDEVIALSDLQGDSYQLSQMAAASTDFPLGSASVESAIGPSTGAPLVDETRYHTPCQGGKGATVSMKLTPLNWWGAWSKR